MSSPDADLIFAGPRALAQQVRDRELSARELVETSLRRIEALDPRLNAFRTMMAEQALVAAGQIDNGGPGSDGPLAGVPIAVKDDLPVAGQRMTWGSSSPSTVEAQDAEVVRKLRAAGAIPIGITNVPELMLFPWTATAANGVTRNPWDLSSTPGGSSGGSAAAVAAGLVAAATASDGGGSIRIPASCCGLVGMKPTRGRVSPAPQAPGWLGLSTYGALARTVVDSALMLDVIHGSVPGDQYSTSDPAGTFVEAALTPPVRKLRIAYSRKLPAGTIAPISADQLLAFELTVRLLAELGHRVEERDPDYGAVGLEFTQTYLRAVHEQFQRVSDPRVTEKSTRQLSALGGKLISERRRDRLLARRLSTSLRIARLWDECDILLTPGLATTAIEAEGGYGRSAAYAISKAARFMPWFPAWNLTGQPAVTLPAGLGYDGLPLSIQLVGRTGAEELLYSLAGQIEAARPWAGERPALAA